MDPVFNVRTETKNIVINNKNVNTIWIEFDTFISNVTDDDIFKLYKYVVPYYKFDADAFEAAGGEIVNYMANDLYMGNNIFMGGYEIEDFPQEMDVSSNFAQGSKRIIDTEVAEGSIYIYQFIYSYDGSLYTFTVSNTITKEKLQDDIFSDVPKIATRFRNQVYRAAVLQNKRNDDSFEVEQDLKALYNKDTEFQTQVEYLQKDSSILFRLYDIEDRINMLLQNVDLYGYGIGKYGRNGGYGL